MENTFVWTDELVEEFEIFYNKIDYAIEGLHPIQKGIQMFKESKQEKPLFTTKDNMPIFEDDKYYYIKADYSITEYVASVGGRYPQTYSEWCYAVEEAANEYVLVNKPCLSVNDFRSCTLDTEGLKGNKQYEKLVELAKSKLK